MDPLSIAASILGILAAAGKVVEILGPVVSTLKDTTNNAAIVYTEVKSSRIIVSSLKKLLDGLEQTPRSRRELIKLDDLRATLTDGVFLFDELEAIVLQLDTSTDYWRTRIQWLRKEKALTSLLSRLQCFKSSISIMLNIIQW
jgi:hypothetical protein